ncbi:MULTISPECIES: DUF3164 family protein [Pseudomonas]|uniref:DUF3164 family protein n=1 Tax=Pseudomonas TaxID=286 RepID=UPI0005A9091D|nr:MULTISPECIES: DUF3164 family protein [Pseudomonas]AZD92020.1 hypothetical protein C4K13_2603 [Pseudomonas chlororaphis subsp. aureofaciens]KAB0531358.1 DUF3164 family protein [Pseudomonas chlororaphis subsp. aureofaciens]TSD32318.1 DUF3164 family protein [Pseudomonas sp. ATCC 13985]WDG62892.1 DUF3164 family protein [Pseudomonas chlororaphis]WDG69159.1 DUF3164 family protein [Pseudomonas chlororaphis]
MSDLIIPEGFVRNAIGHLVPVDQVREQDKLRDQVAGELAEAAKKLHLDLKNFKKKSLGDIADLISIAGERYGVQMGGKKGNVTIATYDGKYKVVRSHADRLTFTEEMEVAKVMVYDCIKTWSKGADNHLLAIVDRTFSPNRNGQIKTSDVLDLLRLEIDDDTWKAAMKAVKDSILVSGSAVYIRVYERVNGTDEYRAIPLDLAVV